METTKNDFVFRIKNSTERYEKSKSDYNYSGIGLQNIKRRLNLLYPNTHNLQIVEIENTFAVELKLRLNDQ